MFELLEIGGKIFTSRLMLGTGKYRNAEEMNAALDASGCEIVTVALRRIDLDAPKRSILDEIDWKRYHILPNTAGARTADEAIRTARLARAMGLSDWIKVEVIPDPKYLLPDPVGTLEACKVLVDEGFVVLPYINADPVLALKLQEIGTATVMPLASPIGSGQGMKTFDAIRIIIEATGCSAEIAEDQLTVSGNNVKLAILMILSGLNRDEAEAALVRHDGFLRKALTEKTD